jgi:two-component system NtrC family sensor kinase
LYLVLFVLLMGSLYLDLRATGDKYRTIATEMGRSFFQAVDTMRAWNLDHGGIFVESGRDIHPNPYLPESFRTATTTDGRILDLINHAQMTRLLSELLTNQRGIHLHIASLKPVRPENRPDSWEQQVLRRFAQGGHEESAVLGEADAATFRYMAPLRTEPRCLTCHSAKEDSAESVLGGITVLFSYAPFQKAILAERRQDIVLHAVFFMLGFGVISVTGSKLLQSISALQDSLLRIKRLEGFLPICAQCKKIRQGRADQREQADWVAIERYIEDRTDAEFTHGLCPQCAEALYPTLFTRDKH